MAEQQQGIKVGFLELAPGVSRVNLYTYLYCAFATIGLLTFVSTGTTQVLNAIGIPTSAHGGVTSQLVIVTEIVQILIFGAVGVLADRVGRREVAAVGIALMGVGYALYPFAESVNELLVYRAIYAFGLGASTGMVGTLVADYPANNSRGKMVAVGGIFNGLGVVLITVVFGTRVAPMLVEAGFSPLGATRIAHAVVAMTCFVSAIIFFLGLKKGTPAKKEERPPTRELIVGGFTEAVKNPRIALSYCCGFVARSDQVILGTFTVLWGAKVGVDAGMDYATASGKGALIFAIAGTSSLIWLPVLGIFSDRFNRVSFVIICMVMAALGYGAVYFVDETTMFTDSGFPLSGQASLLFMLMGAGQISAFMGATLLISQEAPLRKRGAVVGMFNTCGAIGIFVCVAIGGWLFDSVGGWGPFVLIAALNGVVVVLAIITRILSPGAMPGELSKETIAAH
ncbi:MAG: MFS transporter [Gammaproteobacteria bacterium]|nr:MFS transporter [Gammaproteobacteria bacterium]